MRMEGDSAAARASLAVIEQAGLDLFLGSGTTLMAAERTGRRFRGLDIDPADWAALSAYVDVTIERWSARTGLEPQLERPAS